MLKLFWILGTFLHTNYLKKVDITQFKYGWIVITGASDGIGKSLSLHLASKGFKLILISRSEDKLKSLVSDLILQTTNQNIHYIAINFSKSHESTSSFYASLASKLSTYEISALFNNVGVCEYKFFPKQSHSSIEDMLGVNLYPVTFITHSLLSKFLSRYSDSKQRSLIVNFSSSIDLVQVPTSAIYSATKTYIDSLTEGLRQEYSKEIEILTVKPGIVATNMSSVDKGNGMDCLPLTVSSDDYARNLIENLHSGVNYGHWQHELQARLFQLLPQRLLNSGIVVLMPLFEKLGLVKN